MMGILRFTILEEAEGVVEIPENKGAATVAAATSEEENKVATADVVRIAEKEVAKDNAVVVVEAGEAEEGKSYNKGRSGCWIS